MFRLLLRNEPGAEYFQHVEDVSRSNNGDLAHLRMKNNVVRTYEHVEKTGVLPCEAFQEIHRSCTLRHIRKFICDLSRNQMETSKLKSAISDGKCKLGILFVFWCF